MKSNHIDEYVSSGTSPTECLKVPKKSKIVAFHQGPIDNVKDFDAQHTFVGACLLEPIERRLDIEFIERRIAAKRLVDVQQHPIHVVGDVAGPVYPVHPSSIKTPLTSWFDQDTADAANTTSGFHCLYCVLIFPTNARRKEHVKELREKESKLEEKLQLHKVEPRPTKTPLVLDSPYLAHDGSHGRRKFTDGMQRIKMERCYTEAIPQTWVPLTTGLVEPVVSSSFSITTYAPTPQPPPPPVVNKEHYQTSLIPVIPQRSTATTERGINAFRERRNSLLLQRRMLHAAGEQLLKDHIKEGKDLAKKLGVPYTGFKNDYIDRRSRCKECGGTFFQPSKSKLRCRDCGWSFAEKRPRKAASDKANTGNIFHLEGSWDKGTTQAPVRSQKLLPKLRMKYNPWNKTRSEAEPYVLNHPDFLKDVNVLEIQNTSPKEAAAQRGVDYDTFRQQTSRARRALREYDPKTAIFKIFGKDPVPAGFNVGVNLNGVTEIKYLGKDPDDNETSLKALEKHKKTTIKNSLKSLRKKARLNGWSKKMLEAECASARARIEDAYRIPFEGISNTEKAEGTLSQIFT